MASAVIPTTPKPLISSSLIAPPSPGTWRHPRFDEIARRQNATNFNDTNARKVIWNSGALITSWLVRRSLVFYPDLLGFTIPSNAQAYAQYLVHFIRLILLFNILSAILPLMKSKDDVSDIPLTPTQRALFGLDPATQPMTPASPYVTPPRYPRSSTPRRSNSNSRSSSYANSPLSGKGSPSLGRQGSASPFSPSATPLWQKAVGGARDSTRRHSFGSQSPLGPGFGGKDASVLGFPSTPSPSTGRGASVGLNSRWLYERGRASPSSRSLFS